VAKSTPAVSGKRPPVYGTQAYRRDYLLRLEALWARRAHVTLSALCLAASREVVLARLEGRSAPEGVSGACDPFEHDEKLIEIVAWYLDRIDAECEARDKTAEAVAPRKAPTFSARAVSACLTRAGLRRRSTGRVSSGDFYVGAVALWTLPKGSPPTIAVSICPSTGSHEYRVASHEKAVRALEGAAYTLGKNEPPGSTCSIGHIWVVDPRAEGEGGGA
jgi:hypothetical protein